jgi:DNA-binding transcriptional ArsR family regulator
MKNPPIAHGARNMASRLPVNSWTRKVPLTDAMGTQTPRKPETRPRCLAGTWSGSTATRAASSALKSSWAMHQPTRTTGMLGANATMRMPSEPPTRPITIQGRRMPSRDVVRSLILPKNGFPTIANRAPVPVTTAKLLGACSIPTSEFTFNARVTSRGARNSRLLMNANVYSAMYPPPDPACRDRLALQPGGGGQLRLGAGGARPGTGTIGHCALPGGMEPACGEPFDSHARQRGNITGRTRIACLLNCGYAESVAVDDTLRALANPTRRAMLELVWDAERTSSEIAEAVGATRPAASQHLKVLREAGLVRVRADGSQRLYRVDTEQVAEVRAALERFWGARLGRLSAAVAASRERGPAGGAR